MKNDNSNIVLILLLLFAGCDQAEHKEDCIIREWKVIDVYRNNYPSLIDTACNQNFILFNKQQVSKSLLDTVFSATRSGNCFSMDTSGTYEIVANTTLEYDSLQYRIAKLSYLAKGTNVDQEILLWVVKDKGIYIQQERDDKKLFLLNKIKNRKKDTENEESLVKKIMADTVLFPPPPLPNFNNKEAPAAGATSLFKPTAAGAGQPRCRPCLPQLGIAGRAV